MQPECDTDWLLRHQIDASSSEIEDFVERVSIKVESGISILEARAESLWIVRNKRKRGQHEIG